MTDATGLGVYAEYTVPGMFFDPGKFAQCHEINPDDGDPISQYCILRGAFSASNETDSGVPLNVGICLPSMCTEDDIASLSYSELRAAYPISALWGFATITARCPQEHEDQYGPWTDEQIVLTSIFLVFVAAVRPLYSPPTLLLPREAL